MCQLKIRPTNSVKELPAIGILQEEVVGGALRPLAKELDDVRVAQHL